MHGSLEFSQLHIDVKPMKERSNSCAEIKSKSWI